MLLNDGCHADGAAAPMLNVRAGVLLAAHRLSVCLFVYFKGMNR